VRTVVRAWRSHHLLHHFTSATALLDSLVQTAASISTSACPRLARTAVPAHIQLVCTHASVLMVLVGQPATKTSLAHLYRVRTAAIVSASLRPLRLVRTTNALACPGLRAAIAGSTWTSAHLHHAKTGPHALMALEPSRAIALLGLMVHCVRKMQMNARLVHVRMVERARRRRFTSRLQGLCLWHPTTRASVWKVSRAIIARLMWTNATRHRAKTGAGASKAFSIAMKSWQGSRAAVLMDWPGSYANEISTSAFHLRA
jgi:hypothetical protein